VIGRLVWFGDFPLEKTLSALRDVGYDFVELSLDYPLPDNINRSELANVLEAFEMRIAFHSPLDVFIAQPREELFEASLKVLKKCLEFSSEFEPLYYNFHVTFVSPTRRFDVVKEKIVENGRRACEIILEFAKESGFEACLEFDRNFDESFLVDDLKICLDVGHFAILSDKYSEELQAFIDKHGKRIITLHVHDCELSKGVDHIALGNGNVDLKSVLRIAKAKYYTIETFWRDADKNKIRLEDIKKDYEFVKSVVSGT